MSPISTGKSSESGAARMLGSGSAGLISHSCAELANWLESFTGVAELLIFHPVDTIAKRLMSNKAKVWANAGYYLRLVSNETLISSGFVLYIEPHTLPGCRNCTTPSQVYLSLPGPWVCCRLQSCATDVQVRRPAMVQWLDQTALWYAVHEYVRWAEGQDDDTGIGWKVSCALENLIFDF